MDKFKGIVFFDVDGTLIDCFRGISKPTQKTKEAIKKLQKQGYLTMLATGRPKSSIDKGILDLGLDGYIASNGSYADLKKEVLFNYPIKKEIVNELLDYFKENNLDYILEGQASNYVSSNKNQKLNELLKKANIGDGEITLDWNIENIECNKIIVMNNIDEDYEKIYERYRDKGFAFMKHPTGVCFEMYIDKYTKGYGVEELISKLGIERENTYAFGDGENDVEMFQAVEYGIAMGGYHERLKEYAFDFTEDVENDGIYRALNKLNLISGN